MMMEELELEPLAEISIADSKFLGFCFEIDENFVENQLQKLKDKYKDAAHIPFVYKTTSGKDGYDEDGEPLKSVGPGILTEIDNYYQQQKYYINNNTASAGGGVVVVVVRFWGGKQLLGVTCGRLPQCYQSIARLALHRYYYYYHSSIKKSQQQQQEPAVVVVDPPPPLIQEILTVSDNNNVYGLAAGDCELILNVVNEEEEENHLVDKLIKELNYDGFKGAKGEVLPRLQNLQADISNNNNIIPVYRYPGNYQGDEWETFDWNETCLKIKKSVESQLLIPQKMNHCVTNYYRDGTDYIAHHSDKDLDLNRIGVIVSVSLGDERIMELKRRSVPHDTTRIVLPHRSMLVLGPKTNKEFSHSILPKKTKTKEEEETNKSKPRISLTMRDVKTYKDLNTGRLFGQGVHNKSLTQLRTRYLIENCMIFSGFGALSTILVKAANSNNNNKSSSKMSTTTTTCLIWTSIFAVGTISIRMLTNTCIDDKKKRKHGTSFPNHP